MGKKVNHADYKKHKTNFKLIKKIYRFDVKYTGLPQLGYHIERGWMLQNNRGFIADYIYIKPDQVPFIRRFFELQLAESSYPGGRMTDFQLVEK